MLVNDVLIERFYKKVESQVVLAKEFGVSQPTVSLILLRKRYGHVDISKECP